MDSNSNLHSMVTAVIVWRASNKGTCFGPDDSRRDGIKWTQKMVAECLEHLENAKCLYSLRNNPYWVNVTSLNGGKQIKKQQLTPTSLSMWWHRGSAVHPTALIWKSGETVFSVSHIRFIGRDAHRECIVIDNSILKIHQSGTNTAEPCSKSTNRCSHHRRAI